MGWGNKEPGADKERASERRAQRIRMHAERGWPARGVRLAGGGDACDAPSRTGRRKRRGG